MDDNDHLISRWHNPKLHRAGIIIWEANHPYWQLRSWIAKDAATTCSSRWHARAHLAAGHIDPYMNTEHSLRSKVFGFSGGRKTGGHREKPSWHRREPTHNSTHIWPQPGNRTRATLVRGERFTHTPPMTPVYSGLLAKCQIKHLRTSQNFL